MRNLREDACPDHGVTGNGPMEFAISPQQMDLVTDRRKNEK